MDASGGIMKMHGRMKVNNSIIFLLCLLVFQGCLPSGVNRRDVLPSPSPLTEGGLTILSACACENGTVIDGGPSCNVQCVSSSSEPNKVITYLNVSLGFEIVNKIYKDNPKNFAVDKPLKSICDNVNYKCELALKESFLDSDNKWTDLSRTLKVSSSAQAALITSDSSSKSVIKMTGLKHPVTEIDVQILFESAVIHETDKSVTINKFIGDGILLPQAIQPLNSYSCLMAHKVTDTVFKTTLESYHYTTVIPQYFFVNPLVDTPPSTWAFLCHTNPLYVNMQWILTGKYPSLPEPYLEVQGSSPLPRLNAIDTGIKFWGNDEKDFAKTQDSENAITYDIERRVYIDYMKNPRNADEWGKFPIFSLLIEKIQPKAKIEYDQSGRPLLLPEFINVGYYMEPQPFDSYLTARKSFRCPSKLDLESSDEGRLASIKKVLSSASGLLKYSTKPFFAACADGIILGAQQNGAPIYANRKIIYVSYDDLKKMNFSDAAIFSDNYVSPVNFTLKQYYDSKGIPFDSKMANDKDSLGFKLVRRSVSLNNSQSCNDPDPYNSVKDGMIYGCYPVVVP